MRILLWHVHGSWTTAFVQGTHEYLVPVLPDRSRYGLGRARTWDWPASVREVTPAQLRTEQVDVVVLQRPFELELARLWTGRIPGRSLPAVYVEHDAPAPYAATSRHLLAGRDDITLVHVTHFNRLCWDGGRAPQTVVEHGVVDPGVRYCGDVPRAAVVVNELRRRGRLVGADLVETLGRAVPVDLFGMGNERTPGVHVVGNLAQAALHEQLARRRVYVHTTRWTSLGLSLLEAMFLAMPVVGPATTEAPRAVPPAAGVLTNDPDELVAATRRFLADPDAARAAGRAGREHAVRHYGVARFLADWDRLIKEVTR